MITIEDDGLHLIIETEVNDRKCRLLIDTGASRTVFDRTRIFNYVELSTGLGTDSMPTSSRNLNQFKIGKIRIKNFHAILLDLTHVNSSYEKMGFSPIDGVLGSDVMNKYHAVIDYKKKRLTLNKE